MRLAILSKGEWKMDNNKMMEEEDLKGLEEEIDDAVDRLFVEKQRGMPESLLMESPPAEPALKSQVLEPPMKPPAPEPPMKPPQLETSVKSSLLESAMQSSLLEPSYEFEKDLELDRSFTPPPVPIPFLKSIEKMEAQLLSLEWEITEEKLEETREEVLALRELLKQKADITSILSDMEKVLSHMTKNEENIRPPWIKFLLDSKETIKLLMRKETEGQINTYKELAYLGIEARFSCLEGINESKIIQPSLNEEEGIEKKEIPMLGEKKIEDMSTKMNSFMERVEEIFRTVKQQISRLEETTRIIPPSSPEAKSSAVNITIFKVDEKLFGVESEKVFKLFKVPSTFQEKYSNQQKIRLRDLEVKMVDLKKILALQGGEQKGKIKILTVKDNGGYKGFMVDQVLKKLSTPSERRGEVGEYFTGVIYSTFQELLVEIPILDLKKF
jgi:chemotaxis signal transduction protein